MPQPGAGNNSTREKVATVNIKNMGAVDIVYVGGSMFELAFAGKGKKPVRFEVPVMDRLIESNQVRLFSASRYQEIKAGILPDGSTKTHNADGTPKSSASKTMEKLMDDGFVERGADGRISVNADGKPKTKKTKKATSPSARNDTPLDLFADFDTQEDLFSDGFGTAGAIPRGSSKSSQPEVREKHDEAATDPFDKLDEIPNFSDAESAPVKKEKPNVSGMGLELASTAQSAKTPAKSKSHVKDPADSLFSIPSNVEYESNPAFDLFDDPSEHSSEKKANFSLVYEEKEEEPEKPEEEVAGDLGDVPTSRMRRRHRKDKAQVEMDEGILAGDLNGDGVVDEIDDLVAQERHKNLAVMFTLTVTCAASVLLFFLGQSVAASVVHGKPFTLFPNINFSLPEMPWAHHDDGNKDDGGGNTAQDGGDNTGTGSGTVERSDFDPEDAVSGFPMASEEKEKMAILVFQAIRQSIVDGDVKSFNEAVELNDIGTQLTIAYAAGAAKEQGLSEAEQHEVQDAWWATFTQGERQHVADRDSYGSIFGGRIREVRQDPHDASKIYVVMEAIAGDHQRICFSAVQSPDGGWSVNGVMDPEGYTKMIMAGS